jgi:uncharacterized protein GlcG (DUF336 family)
MQKRLLRSHRGRFERQPLRREGPPGNRAHKFLFKGMSATPSVNALDGRATGRFKIGTGRSCGRRNHMRTRCGLLVLSVMVVGIFVSRAAAGQATGDVKLTRTITIISSAGARALVDACTAWAQQNKLTVAMAVLDWGGNVIESHAMEGAAGNAIDTALLKAKSALRWRRATSETNKLVRSGENLAPTFMNDFPQPGALPIVMNGQVIGAMGVSSGDGERCAQAAIDTVFKGQARSSTN